jgi:vacuolar-type H+-ATPase subunit I/STV1
MLDKKGRANAALALLLLASFALGCSALTNLGKGSSEEANKLVQSAADDLEEIDKIDQEASDKQDQLNQAQKDKNVDEVKRIIGELIGDIDRGLERGNSAVDKIDRASKLTTNDKRKEFLTLKAQAFGKDIDAFKSLREAAVIARDNYTANGLPEDKRKEYVSKVNAYKKMRQEARDIHRKADDIARQIPRGD